MYTLSVMNKQLFIKRWLLQGIVVLSPILLTGIILFLVIQKTDMALWWAWDFLFPNTAKPFAFPGLGLLAVISILTLVGALTESWLISQCIKLFNFVLSKVPFIRSIYNTIFKIVESVANSQNAFTNAVLIEYPKKDCYSIAFLTSESSKKFKVSTGKDDLVNVFLPTTPNPTSGFYLIVPKSQIINTDMSPEEAFKLIISAGIVQEH